MHSSIHTLVEVISFHFFSHFFFSSLFFLASDWKRPPCPVHTADYATYVQILTWFFDTPSPFRFLWPGSSAVLARLGLKAVALAWPEAALAFSNARPGQSRQLRLGLGSARLRPWLYIRNVNLHAKHAKHEFINDKTTKLLRPIQSHHLHPQ